MSFARAVLQRLQAKPLAQNAPYTLGRFGAVRRLYASALRAGQRVGAVPGLAGLRQPTLFPDLDPRSAAASIARDSACLGLRLPPDLTVALSTLADAGPLRQWETERLFRRADVTAGRLPDGAAAVLADVDDAHLAPAVLRVAHDATLLEAVSSALGYRPIGCDPRVLVSFAGDYTEAERRAVGQTFEYHFDVHSWSFIYVNIYLVDVDADAGAHVMVRGTHLDKPLGWLLGSARQPDDAIETRYGPDRILTLTGPAGTGFIQDSSCYHKVLAPTRRDRVMLHLRYY
jgi:hypothetical protein